MSEAKFTKGEWICYRPHRLLNSGHVSVETEDGCEIYTKETSKRRLEEDAANAHLIAAAPEMYEMLEHILLEPYGREDLSDERIEKLLAKARGEQDA